MASTRISGFASGMDIDALVKQLMQAERKPLDKLNQSKQLMEWKRDNYREASTKLVTFAQSKINDIFSKSSSMNTQKTSVSGDTSAVTVKASSGTTGVLDIKATQLAKAAMLSSSNAPTTSSSETDWGKVKLSDINNSGISGTGIVKVTIGGAEISIDAEKETLSSFVNKINSNSSVGVSAIFDAVSGNISFTSKNTGAAGNDIELKGSVFAAWGLENKKLDGGIDAKFEVNGISTSRSSNSFSLNGFDITLNNTSETSTYVEAVVTKDIDKVVENIQSFVDAYNEILSYMNGKVNEERYTKYAPLTSDQKKDMSENEIELWEKKAMSGMLKRDTILQSAISDMRMAMIGDVTLADGSKLRLDSLGITTGSYDTRGKLILDVDKLKKALEEDPNVVDKFFGNQYSTSALNNEYTSGDGIFARLRKISNKTLAQMAETAGTSRVSTDINAAFNNDSSIGEQLRSLNRRISDVEAMLNRKEVNYYRKFTAMETAINRYNTMSSNLSSFLS